MVSPRDNRPKEPVTWDETDRKNQVGVGFARRLLLSDSLGQASTGFDPDGVSGSRGELYSFESLQVRSTTPPPHRG